MTKKFIPKNFIIKKNILKKDTVKKFFQTFLSLTLFHGTKFFKKNSNYKNWDDTDLIRSLILLRKNNPKKFSAIYDDIQKTVAIKKILVENKLDVIAAKFLGVNSKTIILYNSFLRIDLPNDYKNNLPWHQDPQLNKNNKFDACTIWCPLVDIDDKIGPLQVLLGTDKKKYPSDKRNRLNEDISKKIILKHKLKEIKIMKNSGFLYKNLLVHKSGLNKSNRIRFVLVFHFNKIIRR